MLRKHLKPIGSVLTISKEGRWLMLRIIELRHGKIAANFCIQYDPEGQMFEEELCLTGFLCWFKTIINKRER